MITRTESDEQDKKRVLKKVRPRYLSKKGENNNTVALLSKPVNPLSTHMINGAWGLIEKDRKICFGIRYLNNLFSINNVQIQEHLNSKTVVLKGQKFEDLLAVPWEYSVKRLESYGDLELATWAKKIEVFNSNAPKVIEDYHHMLETATQETIMNLKRIQSEVRKYKAKLEASYPYKVVSVLHNKNGVNLSSITFSEAMLQEVGLTPEDFAKWAKVHGIPSLFDGHSEFHLNIGKGLLQQSVPLVGGIDVGPEIETFIYDMKGSKRKIMAQHIRVCEPMLNGVLSSGYVIIKSTKLYQESTEEDEILGDLSEHGVKCIKLEGEEETNMNII